MVKLLTAQGAGFLEEGWETALTRDVNKEKIIQTKKGKGIRILYMKCGLISSSNFISICDAIPSDEDFITSE